MSDLKPAPVLSRVASKEESSRLIAADMIDMVSLRLPSPCNLNCRDCCSSQDAYLEYKDVALSYHEITDIVDQAIALGAKHVSFAGDGEPLMYKREEGDIYSLIDCIQSKGVEMFLFTNQTLITPEVASWLFDRNVIVIGKQNTNDPQRQARYFCRNPNAQEMLQHGIENLIDAGFNKTDSSRLALHSIIVQSNYDEIPGMWKSWRRRNIVPYVQVTVPPSDSKSQREFFENDFVNGRDLRTLFERLLSIDEQEFGYTWDVVGTYPIPAMGCSVVFSGCGITPTGDVQICSYTDGSLGNIRELSLKEIMASPQVRGIRRHEYEEQKYGNRCGCRCTASCLNRNPGGRFARDPVFYDFVRAGEK